MTALGMRQGPMVKRHHPLAVVPDGCQSHAFLSAPQHRLHQNNKLGQQLRGFPTLNWCHQVSVQSDKLEREMFPVSNSNKVRFNAVVVMRLLCNW